MFIWDRDLVREDEKVLDLDSGDGCTIIGMYECLMLLNCILKWLNIYHVKKFFCLVGVLPEQAQNF